MGRGSRKVFFSLFFLLNSCFMSICNPMGYDRPIDSGEGAWMYNENENCHAPYQNSNPTAS